MSPRAKNFKAGSIIYFEGDSADSVFLLKQGKVSLTYDNVNVSEQITDQITTGEFFGVKSGLIRLPREETAKVLINSIVFEFSAPEFEALIMKNTQIILKMLKVFSNQLRKVGKQIQSLVSNKISNEPSDEFFHIGEYYLKNKKYRQAMTVYQRYMNYYPQGRYIQLAQKRLKVAENSFNSYGDGGGPAPILSDTGNESDSSDSSEGESYSQTDNIATEMAPENSSGNGSSDEQKKYYKALSFMSQSKYLDAFNILKSILTMTDEEVKVMASFEIGKCFFFLEKFEECVKHYTAFLEKRPNYHDNIEALFYVGNSCIKLGNFSDAKDYFSKIISSTTEDNLIHRKAKKALREIA